MPDGIKIGLLFPQEGARYDSAAALDLARMAEDLGFQHILVYDHVVGINPNRPGGWKGFYTHNDSFLEPFLLFSHLAAVTKKLGFITGVIVLPQRQTVLFAKQAATLDVLCGGRLSLGVGTGWNSQEYEAMNESFQDRGRRILEQITVLRRLWTEPMVVFHGAWHHLPDVCLNPMPIQRPIPLWFGGHTELSLQRAASLGNGWMPNTATAGETRKELDFLDLCLAEAGRDKSTFGIHPRLPYGDGNPDTWRTIIRDWQAAGATHISLNTMKHGFPTPAEHLAAIKNFARAVL